MTLRARVRSVLPETAFLRRDRGDALYITDAPRHGFSGEVPGLRAETEGQLTRLYIKEEILGACDFLPDDLALSLARFQDAPATGDALSLFTEGMKVLEAPYEAGYLAYDRKVRQTAAVALRKEAALRTDAALRTGAGGGLYACALVLAEIKRRMTK